MKPDNNPDVLRECPFCGADARWAIGLEPEHDGYNPQCAGNANCGVFFSTYRTQELALKAWNTRVQPPINEGSL